MSEEAKKNVVLERLEIVYLGVNDIKPNSYNPNRQSEHDFDQLCKSIHADGFTQPVIVHKESMEIVDGEHRWRAGKALGYEKVPCVLVSMTEEQRRVATLRHNRARGSEDAALASDVLRELAQMGAIQFAQDELGLADVEVQRILQDMPTDELVDLGIETSEEQLGPDGQGLSEQDKRTNIDLTADERRAKERILAAAKQGEEKSMSAQDQNVYRLMLIYTGDEADLVREVLKTLGAEDPNNLPQAVLKLCQEEDAKVP